MSGDNNDEKARNGAVRFEVQEIVEDSPSPKPEGESNELLANSQGPKPTSRHPLYEEDEFNEAPVVSSILSNLANYNPSVQVVSDDNQKPPKKKPQLGTLVGVYLPTMQNIFGVLFFLRLSWMVGTAGIFQCFSMVLMCCCCTLLTAISLSAIATNGYVPAGGSYFMISRSLGPEIGGAVGVLFYLGTSCAASMYITGAVEILLVYISPEVSVFGSLANEGVGEPSARMLNNFRFYGTIFLIAMSFLVFVGVKYVNRLAGLFLFCVIVSISCIYLGFFTVSESEESRNCILQKDDEDAILISLKGKFAKYLCNITSLNEMICGEENELCENGKLLDGYEANMKSGLQRFSFRLMWQNMASDYRRQGYAAPKIEGIKNTGMVTSDITTSFMILTGIFFPSCTGIMAGSNRSGDLKNAQKSIPIGTIAAILTTSTVYLSSIVFMGSVGSGPLLRDKFGVSVDGVLFCSLLAWPSKWVVIIGSFLSTIGAGLQSLTGAPRLLQAIAKDDIIPILKVFAKGKANGEPSWALLLTVVIAELGILIASLDLVAPIITIFFLMCYMVVNLACALQTLLRTPNWRPKFRFYHWFLSLIGMSICIFIMFISGWYHALAAVIIAIILYKYIEYAGAEKEWGDGISGLALSAARFGLMRLEDGPLHTKNWRPQMLVCLTMDDEHNFKNRKLLTFANQLKAGKGLTICGTVVKGSVRHMINVRDTVRANLKQMMKEDKVKGFSHVLISENTSIGLQSLVQVSGLGGLNPNTILMAWPNQVLTDDESSLHPDSHTLIEMLQSVAADKKAFIVAKNLSNLPSTPVTDGVIDVWWIVHDGGVMMLLPFLMQKHKVWRNAVMRINTIAQLEDNSIQMKKDLERFLRLLRIKAKVDVLEMPNSDISAYTYERTLMMEQRSEILKNLKLSARETRREVQGLSDRQHRSSRGTISPKSETIKESSTDEGIVSDDATKESQKPTKKPDDKNVTRMHAAHKINQLIKEKSAESNLIFINLPAPPKTPQDHFNYLEFIEGMTGGLDQPIFLVRGSGREVVTIYS